MASTNSSKVTRPSSREAESVRKQGVTGRDGELYGVIVVVVVSISESWFLEVWRKFYCFQRFVIEHVVCLGKLETNRNHANVQVVQGCIKH